MDGVCLETQISEDGGQTFRHTELSPMDFRKIAPIKFDDDDNDGEVPEVPINHVYQEGVIHKPRGQIFGIFDPPPRPPFVVFY